jgi:hypothetical protein
VRAYGYGGQDDPRGRWRKVSVLLADDSADAGRAGGEPCAMIAENSMPGPARPEYFGLWSRLALLDRLADHRSGPIVGVHA